MAGPMFDKTKVFVNQLVSGQKVESVFQVKEASLKTTRRGSPYVDAVLCDRTGQVGCKLWDAPGSAMAVFRPGALLRVSGRVEEYQGRVQVVLDGMPVEEPDAPPEHFVETSPIPPERLEEEFRELCGKISDGDFGRVVEAVFSDGDVWERFSKWPAASQYHHAYRHGLMEHTVSVARLAADVAERTGRVNRDLLLCGALLHDIGKVFELTGETPYEYTDEGRLLGHLYLGARLVERKADGIAGFPEEKRLLISHLILSHHGEREFGSPVLPALPEAVALHLVDNIDAKLRAVSYALEGDGNPNSNWTETLRMLGVRLYKGGPSPEAGSG